MCHTRSTGWNNPKIKRKRKHDESGLFGVISVGIFLNRYMICYKNKIWLGVDAIQSASFNLIYWGYLQKLGFKGIIFNQKEKQRDFVQQEDCVITMRINYG